MIPVNLNADVGESYGRYTIGDDDALFEIVQTANIACGFHGGDPVVMAKTIEAAKARGLTIGAHPGFDDIRGFGRRQIRMAPREIELMTAYQIAAIDGMARMLGHKITHVKPHGALNNMACEDHAYADALANAVKASDPSLIFVAVALSELVSAGERAGLTVAVEAFADRTYAETGMLTSRAEPNAMIHDGARATEQVFAMLEEQAIVTASGKRLKTPIHTICIHGDEPTAIGVGAAVRAAIEASGRFALTPLTEMPLG